MNAEDSDFLIDAALREDLPRGDITSENIIPQESISQALIMAKQPGVLAGIYIAGRVFKRVDSSISFDPFVEDGHAIQKEEKLARVKGCSTSILKAERTALNFLQRLSGVATETSLYVNALKGTKTKILDTRKTTPGWRSLEKYAVRMGGGENHRFSLSDMVLIKDNHLKICGGITKAVKQARSNIEPHILIEVETKNLEEAKEAFAIGVDRIMLDNMPLEEMRSCVDWISGRIPLEVSGNVTLKRIAELSRLGVDFISAGGLTHSSTSLDISMDFL